MTVVGQHRDSGVPKTTRNGVMAEPVSVNAGGPGWLHHGSVMAYNWDVLVRNSTIRNRFANQERSESKGNLASLLTRDCPCDYYEATASCPPVAALSTVLERIRKTGR